MAIRERALGRDHPDVAQSLNNLAGLYNTQGRYAEAEPLFQRSLAIAEKAFGGDHPHVATALGKTSDELAALKGFLSATQSLLSYGRKLVTA